MIGEIAQAHDGSLGAAHAYIDAVAKAGADAVKFQTHIAEAESTSQEPWRVEFSRQDRTRFDYWKRMEFSEDQWAGLKRHAEEKGLLFLSSPFSIEAVELLTRIGIKAWKVASGEVDNLPMLERMALTRLPILLSSGMSRLTEIDLALERIRSFGTPVAVLQCTSRYPCPPEEVGLNMISLFRERYHCPVGLSDHSGTLFPSLAAVALGARIVEVHVSFSPETFGPDVSSSVTTSELKQLVEGVRFIGRMLSSPVDKDRLADDAAPMKALFSKSIVAKNDLRAGLVLKKEHLAAKKPGTGIPAARLPEVIGCRLKKGLQRNQFLSEDILEGV